MSEEVQESAAAAANGDSSAPQMSAHFINDDHDDNIPDETIEMVEDGNGKELMDGHQDIFVAQYFRDHFTLPTPSSTIRFRSAHSAARIFENGSSQFILEETFNPETNKRIIRVKQLHTATKGLGLLRAAYTIVCMLWLGFFFVLCLQVMLILVLDVSVATGQTGTAQLNVPVMIGVCFAIFWFSRGFSSALVIGSTFVADVWGGHYLVKRFFFPKSIKAVFVDWLVFAFFIFFPVVTLCVTLLTGQDDWWSITALFWFSCIGAFYVAFAANCLYFETHGAISFASRRGDVNSSSALDILKRCVLLRQIQRYSGTKRTTYLARSFVGADDGNPAEGTDIYESTREDSLNLWGRFTQLQWTSAFFKKLDPPQKISNFDDIRDNRPYVTKYTHSLERLFCRPKKSRYVVIVDGPGALTQAQLKSSFVCSILGTVLIVLIVVSALVWLNLSTWLVVFALVCATLFCWFYLTDLRRVAKVLKSLFVLREGLRVEGIGTPDDLGIEAQSSMDTVISKPSNIHDVRACWSQRPSEVIDIPSEGIYLVSERVRVTEAKESFCWFMTFLEIACFFVYPVVTLFAIGDWPMGILFVGVGTITGFRHYINVGCIVEETGSMTFAGGSNAKQRWLKQSRLSTIIEAVTYDKTRQLWTLVLLGFAGIIVFIFLVALGDTTDPVFTQELTFLPDFYYEQQPLDVRYPSCVLGTETNSFDKSITMADYAFLSALSYKPDNIASRELTQWFANMDAVEDQETVEKFRNDTHTNSSPVFFRYFRISENNGDAGNKTTGIISIRGTQNRWELLADSQLWSAAMLMQGLRVLLPLGEIWTPVFDELVTAINKLQSGVIEGVSFYKVTTPFAEEIKKDESLDHLFVTGHSLGGGLAIITGAQAKIPAVALSGPNAKISGRSFEPKVTHDDLNRYTFNIVPDRDLVARFDDVADNFQTIRCSAAAESFTECHSFTRSLCEILYTCGTDERPALCECHTLFGYPKPITDGDSTFEEMCQTEES